MSSNIEGVHSFLNRVSSRFQIELKMARDQLASNRKQQTLLKQEKKSLAQQYRSKCKQIDSLKQEEGVILQQIFDQTRNDLNQIADQMQNALTLEMDSGTDSNDIIKSNVSSQSLKRQPINYNEHIPIKNSMKVRAPKRETLSNSKHHHNEGERNKPNQRNDRIHRMDPDRTSSHKSSRRQCLDERIRSTRESGDSFSNHKEHRNQRDPIPRTIEDEIVNFHKAARSSLDTFKPNDEPKRQRVQSKIKQLVTELGETYEKLQNIPRSGTTELIESVQSESQRDRRKPTYTRYHNANDERDGF